MAARRPQCARPPPHPQPRAATRSRESLVLYYTHQDSRATSAARPHATLLPLHPFACLSMHYTPPSAATLDISPVSRRAALSAHLLALSGRTRRRCMLNSRSACAHLISTQPSAHGTLDTSPLVRRYCGRALSRTPAPHARHILMKRLVPMHTHRVAHTHATLPTLRAPKHPVALSSRPPVYAPVVDRRNRHRCRMSPPRCSQHVSPSPTCESAVVRSKCIRRCPCWRRLRHDFPFSYLSSRLSLDTLHIIIEDVLYSPCVSPSPTCESAMVRSICIRRCPHGSVRSSSSSSYRVSPYSHEKCVCMKRPRKAA